VPQTRGAERSRSIGEIVAEVRDLVSRGVKEVTLLGQIVNLYGRHEFPKIDNKSPFVQLLEAVHEVDGLERLRFTSPHPIGFREDLIEAISRLPKLAEHVHLPLQSGSNGILKAMHRAYTAEKYVDLVRRIRRARDRIAITSDIIVGFPGETDRDYEMLEAYLRKSPITHVHVFPYSDRPGTAATELPRKVHGSIVRDRASAARRIGRELNRAFHEAQLDSVRPGLTIEDGSLVVTDNYLKVRIPPGLARNEWVTVAIAHAGDLLTGTVI